MPDCTHRCSDAECDCQPVTCPDCDGQSYSGRYTLSDYNLTAHRITHALALVFPDAFPD